MINNIKHTYKAIIALNNAGVHLLHRGLYTEAIATFRSTLHLMRATFVDMRCVNNSEFEAVLHTAWHRYTYSSQNEHHSSILDASNRIVLVEVHDSPTTIYDTIHSHEPTTNISGCMLLDPVDMDFSISDLWCRIEIDIAVVLYNYGNAYSLKFTSSTTESDRVNANHLLHLCRCSVSNLLEKYSSSRFISQRLSLLLVSLLSVHRLRYISLLLRTDINSQSFTDEINKIMVTVSKYEWYVSSVCQRHPIAPAA